MRARDRSDGRPRRTTDGWAWLGLLVLLAALIPTTAGVPATGGATAHPPASLASLSVTPAAARLAPSGSVVLLATWSIGAPNCTVVPYWFVWTATSDPVVGALNSTVGASVTYSATALSAAQVNVSVRASAAVACAGPARPEIAVASATINVSGPLSVSDLGVVPDPALPLAPVNLTGVVGGGLPPYRIVVSWADGATTVLSLSAPGPFAASHAYAAGGYDPRVTVLDGAGNASGSALGELVYVSDGPALAFAPTPGPVEAGTTVELSIDTLRAPSGAVVYATCGPIDGGAVEIWLPTTLLACNYTAPGPELPEAGLVLGRTVVGPVGLNLTVAPTLSVTADAGTIEAVAGVPATVGLAVTGGAPPYTAWVEGSGLSSPRVEFAQGGPQAIAVAVPAAGDYPVVVGVVDAAGSAVTVPVVIASDPGLNLSLNATRATTENGTVGTVEGTVSGGADPVAWIALPDGPCTPVDGFAGSDGDGSAFYWTAQFPGEGGTAVEVAAVDAAGTLVEATVALALVPALAAQFAWSALGAPNDSANATVTVVVSIAGGLPPFALTVVANGTVAAAARFPTAGTDSANWSFNGSGRIAVAGRLVDALGAVVEQNGTVTVPAAPPGPAPSPNPAPTPNPTPAPAPAASAGGTLGVVPWVGVGVVAAGAAGFLWLRRRKAKAPAPSGPDPTATLKELIAPADGADRATIELLAEEQGIPLGTVRATIDRLNAEGRIRIERADDGEESLTWYDPPPEGPAP
jgi:hypothetical protein